MKPLIFATLTACLIFVALTFRPAVAGGLFDQFTLALVGIVAAEAAIAMLIPRLGLPQLRRMWSARPAGVVYLLIGDALLYLFLAFGEGPIPAWYGNTIRACLLVGAFWLAFAVNKWAWTLIRSGDAAGEIEDGVQHTSVTTLTDRDFPTWPSTARPADPGEGGGL
jgi:hypothetical protein